MATTGSSEHSSNQTHRHVWIWEPENDTGGVLTRSGLENIATHKYKPGSYTPLDNFLNPFWLALTEMLPTWLAPNMVTTLGGLHCGFAYMVSWYYSPNFDTTVPSWVVFLNGACTMIYYTMDCMDGKQARRTGTSSPLGQLFDHGFDCICNLAHLSSVNSYLLTGGTYYFMLMQTSLQFSFFMAQWEEYYTGVLPHATGNIGVTEVCYGLGFFAIINSFFDRKAFWTQTIATVVPVDTRSHEESPWVSLLQETEMRHALLWTWAVFTIVLCLLSLVRVWNHLDSFRVRLSAVSKLFSPCLLCVVGFVVPNYVLVDHTRYISVAMGLVFSLLTKKIIVFSMAKMAFATLQLDIMPLVVLTFWLRFDSNVTELGGCSVVSLLCFWHAYRLLSWAQVAIGQICDRLDIYCFSIKKKSKTS